MRSLEVLHPAGCSLSPEALVEQRGRARRLAPSVMETVESRDVLRLVLASDVDRALLEELIVTERSCCSFLDIEYEEPTGALWLRASDAQGREVVARFAEFFREAAR